MILTGDEASYDEERGAAAESTEKEDIDLEYLISTIPAQFDRTFVEFKILITKLTKEKNL